MEILLLIIIIFALATLPALVAVNLVPPRFQKLRYALTLFLFTLLATPSWAGATIVAVPLPFGALLLMHAFTLSFEGLAVTLQLWPTWHMVAFPVTAVVGAILFRRLRPNYSFKRTAAPKYE